MLALLRVQTAPCSSAGLMALRTQHWMWWTLFLSNSLYKWLLFRMWLPRIAGLDMCCGSLVSAGLNRGLWWLVGSCNACKVHMLGARADSFHGH
jgi:hypothetical protein